MSAVNPGYWRSLLNSFDPRFYTQIVRQSFGRSFVYVILLAFVVSFFLSIKVTVQYNKFAFLTRLWIERNLDEIWPKGLAEVRINNGQVSSDVKQPYIHKWNDFVFILDTTGEIDSLTDYKNGILILKDKIILKVKKHYESRLKEYDLSRVEKFIIAPGDAGKGIIAEIKTKARLISVTLKIIRFWMNFIGQLIFFAMLPVIFIFYISAKTMQGAFFALLSLIPNKMIGANLSYAQLLNISLYALTPATMLAVVLILTGMRLPLFSFVYSVVYTAYIILAIKNIKESAEPVNTAL